VPYVTGAGILAHRGIGAPTAYQTTWAGLCADAIEGALATRLTGVTPSAGETDQLEVAALTDGSALFASKEAPDGIRSMGPDGDVVRIGSDALRACIPVLSRVHPTAGIGIA
jgi:hypothetical protein